ncbi:MAG: DMT family transporter [Undibacterium sp.]|nr:DMT family transporter [Opitutaceae bacterium]
MASFPSSPSRHVSPMLASFLAAFFFALNATYSGRNARAHGPARANMGRLIVAALLLGAFAHTLGHGFTSASVGWFFLSGVIGMGLGDLGVYAALPLLGSRLTVLMTQCLAAPIAAGGEWLWLDTRLSGTQIFWGLVILAGVALALMPSKASPPKVAIQPIGFLFGLLAAAGQGFGALVSRKGGLIADAAGEATHNATFGLNAAYQRILAGLIFASLWFLVLRLVRRPPAPDAATDLATPAPAKLNLRLIFANGLIGPVLGVGCYQWALATAPSGLVLPIVATTPLFAIPLAWWLEGDKPSRRTLVGSLVAVAGCIALTLSR